MGCWEAASVSYIILMMVNTVRVAGGGCQWMFPWVLGRIFMCSNNTDDPINWEESTYRGLSILEAVAQVWLSYDSDINKDQWCVSTSSIVSAIATRSCQRSASVRHGWVTLFSWHQIMLKPNQKYYSFWFIIRRHEKQVFSTLGEKRLL